MFQTCMEFNLSLTIFHNLKKNLCAYFLMIYLLSQNIYFQDHKKDLKGHLLLPEFSAVPNIFRYMSSQHTAH